MRIPPPRWSSTLMALGSNSSRRIGKTLSTDWTRPGSSRNGTDYSALFVEVESGMFLSGKRALVTGSTSGIGLAIARALHAEGAEIVLSGFGDEEAIAALCDELGARHVGGDLSRREGVEALMAGAGPVDILVNNAGVQHVAPVEDFPVDKWDLIIALNLTAAFDACRLAIPHMKAAGWGRIINTASAHSLTASPFKAAYVAAKHGLAGLTKTLALELATHNVTANCISPGYVWTPLVENQIPDTMAARGMSREEVIDQVLLTRQPTRKFVQPSDVGEMAVFLCRDAAANITGANISMDGGWTAE
jgi:3-hydroxybutyrate dehydrogenase